MWCLCSSRRRRRGRDCGNTPSTICSTSTSCGREEMGSQDQRQEVRGDKSKLLCVNEEGKRKKGKLVFSFLRPPLRSVFSPLWPLPVLPCSLISFLFFIFIFYPFPSFHIYIYILYFPFDAPGDETPMCFIYLCRLIVKLNKNSLICGPIQSGP